MVLNYIKKSSNEVFNDSKLTVVLALTLIQKVVWYDVIIWIHNMYNMNTF